MNTTSAEDPYKHYLTWPHVSTPINLILSLPLNTYVMWLILKAPRETMVSDFFSLNLAISETLFSSSNIWLFLFSIIGLEPYIKGYMFSFALLLTARPLFQCCICIENYAGVVHPVLYLRFKHLRYKLTCCCILWLIIALSCTYNLLTFDNDLFAYAYFAQIVLMLGVMMFCSLSVLRALKRPSPGDKDKKKKKKKSNKMKRKAFKIILLIMIFMTINFFFFVTAIPLQCCMVKAKFDLVFSIMSAIAITTGFVQPLLYLHRSGKLPCLKKI